MRHRRRVGWAAVLGVLLGRTSHAGFADPSMSYEDPCLIACPAGDSVFMMVVRNSAGVPWLYDDARLVFCDCPEFALAPGAHDYSRALSGCEIFKYPASDGGDGTVRFAVAGGGVCDDVGVFVAGIPFSARAVASPDHDGDWLVTPSDLARIQSKVGTTDRTADFDCDGVVTPADYSIAAGHLGHGLVATAVPLPSRPGALGFSRPPAPNPARGRVHFTVAVPEAREVDVTVRDLLGRHVARLWRGPLPAGEHGFGWDGVTFAGERARAGLYMVMVRSGESSVARLFTLLR